MAITNGQDGSRVAYCTLVTNDAYVTAALVLAKSLRNTGTNIPLAVVVTPDTVSEAARTRLLTLYDSVVPVSPLTSGGAGAKNLALIGRPDLAATLTKLHVWSLTQYSRVLYLDADTLVLRNLDRLLEALPSDIKFAASPEIGFPDCFNSGVMLLNPSAETHAALMQFAAERESFDGGDQGLLNEFFGDGSRGHPLEAVLRGERTAQGAQSKSNSKGRSGSTDSAIGISDDEDAREEDRDQVSTAETEEDEAVDATTAAAQQGGDKGGWFRLSFTYNMEMHKVYRMYIPAALRYRDEHKVLHFIGKDKPWHFADGVVDVAEEDPSPYFRFYADMVGRWWQVRRSLTTT